MDVSSQSLAATRLHPLRLISLLFKVALQPKKQGSFIENVGIIAAAAQFHLAWVFRADEYDAVLH